MGVPFSAHLDWLSFVIRCPVADDIYTPSAIPPGAIRAIAAEFGRETTSLLFNNAPSLRRGRAPYRWGFKDEQSKAVCWYGGRSDHLTVELPGQSCDWARRLSLEGDLITMGRGLCSRIDIAVDLQSILSPFELTREIIPGRTKSRSDMTSSSGETVYLGSQKSEHYARVYRYRAPHPRSDLLRVEFVARRDRAKAVLEAVDDYGVMGIVRQLWEELQLPNQIDFEEENQNLPLNAARPERGGQNTISWLINQAAPAFNRMIKEGHIVDGEKFLKQYFLTGGEKDYPF